MGCNCGRKRVIRNQQPTATNVNQHAEALVASTNTQEIDTTANHTDPATGTLRSADNNE